MLEVSGLIAVLARLARSFASGEKIMPTFKPSGISSLLLFAGGGFPKANFAKVIFCDRPERLPSLRSTCRPVKSAGAEPW